MKGQLNLSIDTEVLARIKKKFINLSLTTENFYRAELDLIKAETTEDKLSLARIKIENLIKDLREITKERDELKKQLESVAKPKDGFKRSMNHERTMELQKSQNKAILYGG